MFGEHIEEVVKLMKENGQKLDASEIAMSVIDIAFSQGLIQESEIDQAASDIMAQARYMYNLP
jgi:hypothetical protein